MNSILDTTGDIRVRIATSVAAALLLFGALGCGANQTSDDSDPTRQTAAARGAPSEADEPEEPTDEELADSPCGNPQWATLPEGARKKSADSSGGEEEPPNDDEDADSSD